MTRNKKAILSKAMIIFGSIILLIILVWGLSLYQLYRQVGNYRAYWERNNQAPLQDNSLHYTALGDSTAQGIGASAPRKGYVGLLANSLQQEFGRPVDVLNLSVSGAKVKDVTINQIPKLANLATNDSPVTLAIGANDMHSFTQESFQRDIAELFDKLPSQTLVATIGYFGGGRYRRFESNVKQANEIIKSEASKRNLEVVDLHQLTMQREKLWNHSVDILHPSNRGYRNWHDAFWPQLKAKY